MRFATILALGLCAAGCSGAPDSRGAIGTGVSTGSDAPLGTSAPPTRGPAVPAATNEPSAPPTLITLEVGGMTCSGCVARVQHSLAAVPGVHRVDVSLDKQKAVVLADPGVVDTALTGAVRRAGSEFLGIVVAR